MNFISFLEEQDDMAALQPYFRAVASYLGVQPSIAKFYKYSEDEWGRTFGNDHEMLLGRTAAIFDNDRNLHVRQGVGGRLDSEGVLLHEVVHAAGMDKFQFVSKDVNEGITQLTAEEIGRIHKLPVAHTYHEEIVTLKRSLLPLVGMDFRQLARSYAMAQDPAMFLAGLIWSRYWHHFQNRDDWGDPTKTRDSILRMFKESPFTGWPYLDHLVDDLRLNHA